MTFLGKLLLRYPHLARVRKIPGIGPVARALGRKAAPRDDLVWARVRSGPAKGLLLELNPRTGAVYFEGEVEPAVQAEFTKLLRPGDVVYDIGANVGFFTLLAARLVGPTGQVVAFEPDPEVAHRLRENVRVNGFGHVDVIEAAVWSTSGRVTFARADSSITPDLGHGHVISTTSEGGVVAIALDDLVRDGARAPTLLKVDVEGAEAQLLRGARNVLTTVRPYVLVEVHTELGPKVEAEVRAELESAGYRLDAMDDRQVLGIPPGGAP